MLAPVLSAIILLGYALSLWWLLRRESTRTLLALAAVCGVSLTLRLVYLGDYPAGLHEDEPKILSCVLPLLKNGRLFAEDCTGLPAFLTALFQAQLVPLFGPTRWAIRLYSLVTSVLCVPLAFAAGRALGLRVGSSLAAGTFVAVLPWAIFWGRISMGGELTFHQLLLVAALARLVWQKGGVAEVGIGGLGLCLLLYDYWGGRAMLGMPFLAAVLATRHRRVLCLAVLAVAIAGWWPYIGSGPRHAYGGANELLDPHLFERPLQTLSQKSAGVGRALVSPAASNGALTVAAAAMHPLLILALAIAGIFAGWRRALFLGGGFMGGILPSLLSVGAHPSAHRMMMAFPFIFLTAASSFDMIRRRNVRTAATLAAVLIVAIQSISLYFSAPFWPVESRWIFDWERTAVAEAIPVPVPPPARLVVAPQLGYFFRARKELDPNYERLVVDNWFPANDTPLIYAFTVQQAPLREFYAGIVGADHIERFGRAFVMKLDPGDWSWMRQHGWAYEARCGDRTWRAQVPVLYQTQFSFRDLHCGQPITHRWRARWEGPRSVAVLRFTGSAVVQTPRQHLHAEGRERAKHFAVEKGMEISIAVTATGRVWAGLFEVTPEGERIPPWQYATPVGLEE